MLRDPAKHDPPPAPNIITHRITMKAQTKAACLDTVFEYLPSDTDPDFWVITAYNPGGRPANPGDNIGADARLRAEIRKLEIPPFRINVLSHDETHAEPGWGFPCDEATAIGIAKKFRQQAVCHFTSGRIDLVDCKTLERHPLENPATRIRNPRDLRHFTLFVGSPAGRGGLDPLEYAGVCTRIGALFSGFTIQRAGGYFQSRFEETLLIHIATREAHKVLEVAHSLRCFLNQEGIGISHHGIYQRIRDWTDDELILASLGIALPPASNNAVNNRP
jgi:hypothetical protein